MAKKKVFSATKRVKCGFALTYERGSPYMQTMNESEKLQNPFILMDIKLAKELRGNVAEA